MNHPADCEHITDPVLIEWYRNNPACLPACCWFAGRAVVLLRDGSFRAFMKES